MNLLRAVPSRPYTNPWDRPYRDRFKALFTKPLRVCYFYERADNSTFRYRAYNMAQALDEKQNARVAASYFFKEDLSNLPELLECSDAAVVCRWRYDENLAALVSSFHREGKPVLFDIDDFVFNIDYVHVIMSTLRQDMSSSDSWDHWYAYVGRLGAALKLCDGAITTNDYLAERIRDYKSIPVHVIPNFLNREQIQISEEILAAKKRVNRDPTQIFMGYFSGSPTHLADFEVAAEGIAAALESDERLRLCVVGYMEVDSRFAHLQDRIRYYPFQDFVNLQRLIGAVDINLMPLQNNIFTNCKSELKFFEAAAVGTWSIASPTYTYSRAIDEMRKGRIAKSHDWFDAIQEAVQHTSGPDKQERLLYLQQASIRYHYRTVAPTIEDALLGWLHA